MTVDFAGFPKLSSDGRKIEYDVKIDPWDTDKYSYEYYYQVIYSDGSRSKREMTWAFTTDARDWILHKFIWTDSDKVRKGILPVKLRLINFGGCQVEEDERRIIR